MSSSFSAILPSRCTLKLTIEMRFRVGALFSAAIWSFPVHAATGGVEIGDMPAIIGASPALSKTLHALRQRIESDAQDCMESAKAMEAMGNYRASVRKGIETARLLSLEISGVMICDGVHSSSYHYGIAVDKKTGVRVDLSRVYDIVNRENGHSFLQSKLVEPAKESYRQENAGNASCLDNSDWETGLTNFPLTFLPESDGSLVLYYAVPEISSACFPPLHLSRRDIAVYRNAVQADKYNLP